MKNKTKKFSQTIEEKKAIEMKENQNEESWAHHSPGSECKVNTQTKNNK